MAGATSVLTTSRLWVCAAVVVASLPLAVLAAVVPSLSAVGLLAASCLVLLVLVSPARLPSVLLIGMVVVPSLTLAGLPFLFGQASLVLLIVGFTVVRWGAALTTLKLTPAVLVALATYIGGTLLMVVVGSASGTLPEDATGALRRDFGYLAALPVGFASAALTRDAGRISLNLFVPAAVACTSAVLFMLHSSGATISLLSGLFMDVSALSRYGERAIYPFIEDSPNVGAAILVLLWSLAGPVLLLASVVRHRLLGIGITLLLVPAVLATQSRTGILAMVVAFGMLLVLGAGSRHRRASVAALAGGSAATWYLYQQLPEERSLSLEATTFVARTGIWRQGWVDFERAPLFGNGFDFSAGERYMDSAQIGFQYVSIHNSFLGALIDGGIVGLIATILVPLAVLGWMGSRLLRAEQLRAQGVAVFVFLAALVTSMMASASLNSAAVSVLFWLLFGIAAGLNLRLGSAVAVLEPAHPRAPRRLTRLPARTRWA